MINRKTKIYLLLALLAVALILFFIIRSDSQKLKVVFLNVGQGDAILISQGSNQILIDGGPNEQVLMDELGKYVPFWDRKIELMIATHPDQDHISGLIAVAKNYQVGAFMDPDIVDNTPAYQQLKKVIREKNIPEITALSGEKIKMNGAEMDILHPDAGEIFADTNSASVVAKLVFGKNSFLFTGDLPNEKEAELIAEEKDLSAEVLKVGHHGSRHSTSEEFLDAVKPQDAVISVGKHNMYGHPTKEVLDRLQAKGIRIFRTDQSGDMVYECQNKDELCQMVAN